MGNGAHLLLFGRREGLKGRGQMYRAGSGTNRLSTPMGACLSSVYRKNTVQNKPALALSSLDISLCRRIIKLVRTADEDMAKRGRTPSL